MATSGCSDYVSWCFLVFPAVPGSPTYQRFPGFVCSTMSLEVHRLKGKHKGKKQGRDFPGLAIWRGLWYTVPDPLRGGYCGPAIQTLTGWIAGLSQMKFWVFSSSTPFSSRSAFSTEAQKRAQKKYMSSFVEIKVRVTPEKRAAIQAHAQTMGESATMFINRAIDHEMERDNQQAKEGAGE